MGIMIDIQDFESCETSGQFYGGNAGRKIGLVWRDGDWLVKFPGTTRNLQGSVPSYTTAPVSEWLGSHVYAALGIPVHETVLGIRDGRIVCACRDFTFPDSRLVNFHDLKNSLSDDEPGFTEDASTGSGVVLADVRSAIHRIPVLRSIDGVSDRFWDMFVVDAFIRNIFLIPIPPSCPHLLFRRVSTVRECDASVSISMVKERGTDNRTIESVS